MFRGLATGIGSLPHRQAQAALDLVFRYCPQVPFWPQLPRRDKKEGMLRQFSQMLPLAQEEEASPGDKERQLEEFYEKIIAQDVDYFKITPDYAAGLYGFKERLSCSPALLQQAQFLKCHITGPFTVCAGTTDKQGQAYLHHPEILQAAVKGLAMKAIWQVEFLRGLAKPLIVFIDEPYLGCFGSAYTPLGRQQVIEVLKELACLIKAKQALVGLHCCGNTDWSIITDTAGIDIISFDAYEYLERVILYAEGLNAFLERGGILSWGIVPTQRFTSRLKATELVSQIKQGVASLIKKGVSKSLLQENLLLSPACGLGSLDVEKAEGIFSLLDEASGLVRESAL